MTSIHSYASKSFWHIPDPWGSRCWMSHLALSRWGEGSAVLFFLFLVGGGGGGLLGSGDRCWYSFALQEKVHIAMYLLRLGLSQSINISPHLGGNPHVADVPDNRTTGETNNMEGVNFQCQYTVKYGTRGIFFQGNSTRGHEMKTNQVKVAKQCHKTGDLDSKRCSPAVYNNHYTWEHCSIVPPYVLILPEKQPTGFVVDRLKQVSKKKVKIWEHRRHSQSGTNTSQCVFLHGRRYTQTICVDVMRHRPLSWQLATWLNSLGESTRCLLASWKKKLKKKKSGFIPSW